MEVERVATGIESFDKLIEGGLPKGSINLITGTPGTAKTIFGMQFLANGAKNGEKGLCITLEESTESLIRQMRRFGYDLQTLIDSGNLKIIEIETGMGASEDPFTRLTKGDFVEELKKFEPNRVLLDSINLVTELSMTGGGERRAVGEVAGIFKYLGATTVFTHERRTSSMGSLEYSIEEFLVDGIIHLQLHMTERLLKRYITVIKMRETSQSTGIYEFSIREDGISIRE
jgi:circadian clock protein KaiC